MKKRIAIPFLLVFLVACENTTQQPGPTPQPPEQIVIEGGSVQEPEQEYDPFVGMVINPLTGMWIDEEYSNRRPMAYVINNLPMALPQSGISQADIIYEVIAEGGITRLVAIFTNSTADKIGPIRSTREYFSPLAINHGAVLVHHGGSPSGYDAIRNMGIQNLDGMSLEGTIFWRDPVRWNAGGMREHSSYTNQENVLSGMQTRGFSTESSGVYVFNFFEEHTVPTGFNVGLVDELVLPFSTSHIARFDFDHESGLFYRYQRGQAHWDEYTDSQVTVSNIIIQQAPMSLVPGDTEGRMNVSLIGNGSGYLVTAGTYAPITWQRSSANTPTIFLDSQNNPINLNPGQTWIGILGTTSQTQPSFNVIESMDFDEINGINENMTTEGIFA